MTDIPQDPPELAFLAADQVIRTSSGVSTLNYHEIDNLREAIARALMEERERAVKACFSARDEFAPTDDAYKACIYYVEAIRKGITAKAEV